MVSSRGKFLDAALAFVEQECLSLGYFEIELYVPSAWFPFLSEVSKESIWIGHTSEYGIWGSWDPRNKEHIVATNFKGERLFSWPLPDPLTINLLSDVKNMDTPARLYPLLLSDGFSRLEAMKVCASLSRT